MNERGFFTIIGLCLLLILAISIKGVQEFEGNYSVGVYSVKSEYELQNIADGALIEAVEKIRTNPEILKDSSSFSYIANQAEILNGEKNGVDFKVLGERTMIEHYNRNYYTDKNGNTRYNDVAAKDGDSSTWSSNAVILISVASCDSGFVDGKIYRKSIAYILDNDPETIHFMNDL